MVVNGTPRLRSGGVFGWGFYGALYDGDSTIKYFNIPAEAKVGYIQGRPIDFPAVSAKLVAMSLALKSYGGKTPNKEYSTLVLSGSDPELNVFTIDAGALTGVYTYSFRVPQGASVIVNVTGTSPIIRNVGFDRQNGIRPSQILFNFPDATALEITSVGFMGSILAPKADAQLRWGLVQGTVVVNAAVPAFIELHWAPFDFPGCGGCLCRDPSWSCSGDTKVDDRGNAIGLAPEAGLLQIDGGTYKAENTDRTSPTHRVWYSFQPATTAPESKPLAVFFNGGPGSATSSVLFSFNTGPWTLDPDRAGSQQIVRNDHSWTKFANLLYIDAPGTGFSYPMAFDDGSKPSVGIDMDRDAGTVLRIVLRFLARHPNLRTNPVLLVGESYGGMRASLMLYWLFHYAELDDGEYRDDGLYADLMAYFGAVFGQEEPSAKQIATKFSHQVLIEPVLVGGVQRDLHQKRDTSWCPPLTSADPYNCDKTPFNWFLLRSGQASENLARLANFKRALGVEPTSIEWLKAKARTKAYGRKTGNTVVPTPEWNQPFGPEGLQPDDCYFSADNSQVRDGYPGARQWSYYGTYSAAYGGYFLNNVSNVTTFITVAKFDIAVWSPAIELAINLPSLNLPSTAVYDPNRSTGLARPGAMLLTDDATGVERRVTMPLYLAGHSVTQRQPAEIRADVMQWYGSSVRSEAPPLIYDQYYDRTTVCTAGSVTMHCCPRGYVMVGAHLGDNVFKCGRPTDGLLGLTYADFTTQRNGMRACPVGMLMVGLHSGRNVLACQSPLVSAPTEVVDGNPPTTDGYMHVCPSDLLRGSSAMAGINFSSDRFTCRF